MPRRMPLNRRNNDHPNRNGTKPIAVRTTISRAHTIMAGKVPERRLGTDPHGIDPACMTIDDHRTATTDSVKTIAASTLLSPGKASICGRLASSDRLPQSASPKLGTERMQRGLQHYPESTNHAAATIASTTPKYNSPSRVARHTLKRLVQTDRLVRSPSPGQFAKSGRHDRPQRADNPKLPRRPGTGDCSRASGALHPMR